MKKKKRGETIEKEQAVKLKGKKEKKKGHTYDNVHISERLSEKRAQEKKKAFSPPFSF